MDDADNFHKRSIDIGRNHLSGTAPNKHRLRRAVGNTCRNSRGYIRSSNFQSTDHAGWEKEKASQQPQWKTAQFSIPTKSGDYVLKVSSPGFRPYEQVIRWSPSSKGSSEPLFIVLHVSEGGGVCLLPCGGFENPSVPVLQSSLSSMIPLEPLLRSHFTERLPKGIPAETTS